MIAAQAVITANSVDRAWGGGDLPCDRPFFCGSIEAVQSQVPIRIERKPSWEDYSVVRREEFILVGGQEMAERIKDCPAAVEYEHSLPWGGPVDPGEDGPIKDKAENVLITEVETVEAPRVIVPAGTNFRFL